MWIIIFISEVALIIIGLLMGDFTFDFDKDSGIFGFFDKDLILYAFFVVGFFTGAISLWTSAQVVRYFPPVVLLISFLFEPLLS